MHLNFNKLAYVFFRACLEGHQVVRSHFTESRPSADYRREIVRKILNEKSKTVDGLTFHEKKEDVPQILTLDECKKLL